MALCADGDWDVYGWAHRRIQLAAQARYAGCDMNYYQDNALLCVFFAVIGLSSMVFLFVFGPVIDKIWTVRELARQEKERKRQLRQERREAREAESYGY